MRLLRDGMLKQSNMLLSGFSLSFQLLTSCTNLPFSKTQLHYFRCWGVKNLLLYFILKAIRYLTYAVNTKHRV